MGSNIEAAARAASRRVSLGSLLTVPAETWTPRQIRAAARTLQLQAAPSPRFRRYRLRFKQFNPHYPHAVPVLCVRSAQQVKRVRLRFKQHPSAALRCPPSVPCSNSVHTIGSSHSSRSAQREEHSRGSTLSKTHAKWSALLLGMGFSQGQINEKLGRHKTLHRTIDALCSLGGA